MSEQAQQTVGHTPGPWHWEHQRDKETYAVDVLGQHEHGPIIAKVNTFAPSAGLIGCGGSPAANANLIAAAPEMLEALKDLTESLEPADFPEYHRALEVIAKAEGD